MSRVIQGSVVAVALAAAVAAGTWMTKTRVDPPPLVPVEPAPQAAGPQAPPPAGPPAPDPRRVAVTLSERRNEIRISPAGGTVTATAPDGTRVSLIFPPGSLWRSEEITLQVVETLTGAPFAAAPMAVSAGPETLLLRRPPLLVFEPRGGSAFDGGRGVAGFAVRNGAELSLHPAVHYPIAGSRGRYRIAMRLARLGTYGVANAAGGEVAAAAVHEPSDAAARLAQRIALAYALQAPGPAQASSWSLIPRVHAQGVSLFIHGLVKGLLDYYQQVVLPKFDQLPTSDCLSNATFDAIDTYFQWRATVELLMPLERDGFDSPEYLQVHDRLVAQRETMLRERGYTDAQIAEIDGAIEQFRGQFDSLSAAIDQRIRPALAAQFVALHRCCTTQRPMEHHLTTMMRILRFGELNGYAPVDPDPMPKVMECACLVGSNRPGAEEQFTGTLRYEEQTALARSQQINTRRIENSETLTFQQSSVLTFPRAGGMLSDSNASAALARFSSTTDDYGTCVVHGESQVEVDGRDNDVGLVSININAAQGRYTLRLDQLPVEGTGRRRNIWNVKGPACGKFNRPRDDVSWASRAISPVPSRTVSGELDPGQPYLLKGSKVFEQEDRYYGATRTATLTWEIQRCRR